MNNSDIKAGTEALRSAVGLKRATREFVHHKGLDPDAPYNGKFGALTHEDVNRDAIAAALRAYLSQPEQPALGTEPVWHVGVWGNGSTPFGLSNIFCDAWEVTIAEGISTQLAEEIVEAHNASLTVPPVSPDVAALQAENERLEANVGHWLNEARRNLKYGQEALDRAEAAEALVADMQADKSVLLAFLEYLNDKWEDRELVSNLITDFRDESIWVTHPEYADFHASLKGLVLDGEAGKQRIAPLAERYIK